MQNNEEKDRIFNLSRKLVLKNKKIVLTEIDKLINAQEKSIDEKTKCQ